MGASPRLGSVPIRESPWCSLPAVAVLSGSCCSLTSLAETLGLVRGRSTN